MDEPPVKIEIRPGGSTERYAFHPGNRERVAARAHAVDEAVSPHRSRACRRRPWGRGTTGRIARRNIRERDFSATRASRRRASPRVLALDLPRQQRPHRYRSRIGPYGKDTEICGPSCSTCGYRAPRKTWISSYAPNIGPDGNDVCECRPAWTADPVRDQRLAARVAHRKLDRKVTAVPAVSFARQRRCSSPRGVECLIEVWPTSMVLKGTSCASTCSRATGWAARRIRTITATTTPAQRTRCMPEERGNRT